ncbi:hypothetical protein OUZ56_014288 [Daphnia magna]|uniref:Uncharacterized protein n=1 Tax=Daphnia magna TaxID=35525 RepID=A0ABR0AJQ4_9CRUS|nr:hypothetical protein OUZ56_014288 [Daphnia magna]
MQNQPSTFQLCCPCLPESFTRSAMAEQHGANDIRASSDILRRWRRGSPRNVVLWDRALFYLMVYAMGRTVAAPLGAVGNAPVGTSLCRCGGRFLGCAFPEWNLLPCQPGLVFGQVPPCSRSF